MSDKFYFYSCCVVNGCQTFIRTGIIMACESCDLLGLIDIIGDDIKQKCGEDVSWKLLSRFEITGEEYNKYVCRYL